MNSEIKKRINDNWTSYHIPGCGVIHRIKRNVIFLNSGESFKHAISKSIGAIMLNKYGQVDFGKDVLLEIQVLSNLIEVRMKEYVKSKANFITEAVPNKEPSRRIDLVNLNNGDRIEFEVDHTICKSNCKTIYI